MVIAPSKHLPPLLLACVLALPSAAVASYQSVARLPCPDGDLLIDARPYAENEAGSSQADLRYRYRGIELPAIQYEQYYRNLDRYLQQDAPRIRQFGLDLDTSGASKSWRHQRGDTLYLPPAQFTADEVDRLAACITAHQVALGNAFAKTTIHSSAFLGLMKTKASIGLHGIARIVHADPPLIGIYSAGWLLVLIERDGRVLLHTNFTANNPVEAVTWGQVQPAQQGGKPTMRLERVRFRNEIYDSSRTLSGAKNRHGRHPRDDYDIVPQ